MTAHVCPDCQMLHDVPAIVGESEAVAIARIQADSALAIEKLRSRTDRHIADDAIEADVEIAEIEADAEVVEVAAEAEILGAAIRASDTDPAEVIMPPPAPVEEEPLEDAPPVAEASEPPQPRSKLGLGVW